MNASALPLTYLLASRGLVFSPETGFTFGPLPAYRKHPVRDGAECADRAYWTAYDYFEEEREARTARRAARYAAFRAKVAALIDRLARPAEGTANVEHVAA